MDANLDQQIAKLELVRTVAGDGLELLGLRTVAVGPQRAHAVFLHGMYDNAYQQWKNHAIARSLAEIGIRCTLANTRGQDYVSYHRVYSDGDYRWRRVGTAHERLTESALDVDAWLSSAAAEELPVFLIGHSHGAVKLAEYVTTRSRDPRVAGLCLVSPSDDISVRESDLGSRYAEALELARNQVSGGREDVLMPDWAYPQMMSAGTFLEAFGEDSPLEAFRYSKNAPGQFALGWSWNCPLLVVFGEDDSSATGNVGSNDACEVLLGSMRPGSLRCEVIPSANHHYKGVEAMLGSTIASWAGAIVR